MEQVLELGLGKNFLSKEKEGARKKKKRMEARKLFEDKIEEKKTDVELKSHPS